MYVLPLQGVETRNVLLPNRLPCVLASSPRAIGCVLRLTFPVGSASDSRAHPGLASLLAAVYGVERPNGHHPLPGAVELGWEETHIDIAYATARGAVSELLRRVQAPFPDEVEATSLWYEAKTARARWTEEAKLDVRLANLVRRHHFTQASTYSLPWPHGNRFELDPEKVDRPSYTALLMRWVRDYRPSRARVTILSAEPLDDLAHEVSRLSVWVDPRGAGRVRRGGRQDLKPPWKGTLDEVADVRVGGTPVAVIALSFPTGGSSSESAKYLDLLDRFSLGDVRVTSYRLRKASIAAFSVRVSADPQVGNLLASVAQGVLADTVRPIIAGDEKAVYPLARDAFTVLARDLGAVHREPYEYMRAVYPYLWPDPPPISLVRAGVLRPRATTDNLVRLFRDLDHARVSVLRHPDVDLTGYVSPRRLLCRAFGW